MKQFVVITLCIFIAASAGLSVSYTAQYDPEVYQAQKALRQLGYNPGKPDGLWGKLTESAVKRFQRDVGLPVTGQFDEQTKAKLGIAKSTKERRIALVIGNSAYKSSPLINPVSDAQDMATTLRSLGFEVLHKENAGQRTMEDAIFKFSNNLKKGGVGLFYFAGHGVQLFGRNFLIPIGANIRIERDIKYKAVDAGQVLDGMYDAGNGLNIVLLDACRVNPFVRSSRTNNRGLARMDAPTGTFIAYATAPGSIAADGIGRNGIFTKHLLKNMRYPGLTIERVLKLTRNGVMSETGNKQVPWQSSSLTGDFYFASGDKLEPQTSTQHTDERAKLERERQELERLKLEIARKKLEAERKRLKEEQKKKTIIASIDPKDREIGRDDHYIAYANGVVRDTKTGLEWVAGPDKDTDWYEAKEWVGNLKVAGGGWRMPTTKELEALYQNGKGALNMTPLLKTTGHFVWSGETIGSSSARFWFYYYGLRTLHDRSNSNSNRAFAVRSRR